MMNGDYISTLIELKPKYKNVSAQEMQLTKSCSSMLGIHQINVMTPLNIWHLPLSVWFINLVNEMFKFCAIFPSKRNLSFPTMLYHIFFFFFSNSDELKFLVCDQNSLFALAIKFGHF